MSPVTSSPLRTPACTAAPYATASSGLTPRLGSFFVKEVSHQLLNLGDTGRSSNQNNLVNFRFLHTSIF